MMSETFTITCNKCGTTAEFKGNTTFSKQISVSGDELDVVIWCRKCDTMIIDGVEED